jgi:hypothetical protein
VLTGATAVATGHYHSLVLRSGGTVSAWGFNGRGQVGPNGGTKNKVAAPVSVSLPAAAVQVAGGRAHSLALLTDGSVYTWGDNGSAQLGYGSADTARHPAPQKVPGLPAIRFVAAGRDSTFAIATNGDLYGWGNSQYGQVGQRNFRQRRQGLEADEGTQRCQTSGVGSGPHSGSADRWHGLDVGPKPVRPARVLGNQQPDQAGAGHRARGGRARLRRARSHHRHSRRRRLHLGPQ